MSSEERDQLQSGLPASYAAVYTDENGREATAITNDGKLLRMIVRGVEFVGSCFDDFEPAPGSGEHELSTFRLNKYPVDAVELCDCKIECAIPIPIQYADRRAEGILNVTVELGRRTDSGFLEDEVFRLELELDGDHYHSRGMSGWFEGELLDIQKVLPPTTYMLACFNCAFSDYSVYGHSAFADMLCFRGTKREYLAVTTKTDYMGLQPTETVQETYLCPEFLSRQPGTGYRG